MKTESVVLQTLFDKEYGENKELSFGRCRRQTSFNDLFDGLKNIE